MELYKKIWRNTRSSIGENGVELRKKDVRSDVHKSVINQTQSESRKLGRNIVYMNEIKQIEDKKEKKQTYLAEE